MLTSKIFYSVIALNNSAFSEIYFSEENKWKYITFRWLQAKRGLYIRLGLMESKRNNFLSKSITLKEEDE